VRSVHVQSLVKEQFPELQTLGSSFNDLPLEFNKEPFEPEDPNHVDPRLVVELLDVLLEQTPLYSLLSNVDLKGPYQGRLH